SGRGVSSECPKILPRSGLEASPTPSRSNPPKVIIGLKRLSCLHRQQVDTSLTTLQFTFRAPRPSLLGSLGRLRRQETQDGVAAIGCLIVPSTGRRSSQLIERRGTALFCLGQ